MAEMLRRSLETTLAISCEAVAPVPRPRGHTAAPCVGVPGAAVSLVSFIALFDGAAHLTRMQDPMSIKKPVRPMRTSKAFRALPVPGPGDAAW